MTEATAVNVAKFIYEEIVLQFGVPDEIISDRGSNFMAEILEEYLTILNVKHKLTSAYHPRSNGAVERANRVFNEMLTKYCENHTHYWDNFYQQALFTCRIKTHNTTHSSPYELVYGIKPKLPGDNIVPQCTFDDDIKFLENRKIDLVKLHENRENVKEALKANAQKMKEYFDDKHGLNLETKFKENDIVLLGSPNQTKFKNNWTGPFVVKRAFPLGTYKLTNMNGIEKEDLVHGDRLKKAYFRLNNNSTLVSNEEGGNVT